MLKVTVWLLFVVVPTLVLWAQGWPVLPFLNEGWHNLPYSVALIWAMWQAHEYLGWFETPRHPDPYYGDSDRYHGIRRR